MCSSSPLDLNQMNPVNLVKNLGRSLTPDIPQLPGVPAQVAKSEEKVSGPMQSAADPARKTKSGRRGLRIDPAVAQAVSGTRSGLSIPGA